MWAGNQLIHDHPIGGGTVTVPDAVTTLSVGLPFTHEISALPPAASDGTRPHGGNAVRLVSATLRLQKTGQLRMDTGRGLRDVRLPVTGDAQDANDGLYSGDITLRSLGWRRGSGGTVNSGLWRIAGDLPRPFLLLGVASELGVND